MKVLALAWDVLREAFRRRNLLLFLLITLLVWLVAYKTFDLDSLVTALKQNNPKAAPPNIKEQLRDAMDSSLGIAGVYLSMLFGAFLLAGVPTQFLRPGRVEFLAALPLGRNQLVGGLFLGTFLAFALVVSVVMGGIWGIAFLQTDTWLDTPPRVVGAALVAFLPVLSAMILGAVAATSTALTSGAGILMLVLGLVGSAQEKILSFMETGATRSILSVVFAPLPRVNALAGWSRSGTLDDAALALGPTLGMTLFLLGASMVLLLRRDLLMSRPDDPRRRALIIPSVAMVLGLGLAFATGSGQDSSDDADDVGPAASSRGDESTAAPVSSSTSPGDQGSAAPSEPTDQAGFPPSPFVFEGDGRVLQPPFSTLLFCGPVDAISPILSTLQVNPEDVTAVIAQENQVVLFGLFDPKPPAEWVSGQSNAGTAFTVPGALSQGLGALLRSDGGALTGLAEKGRLAFGPHAGRTTPPSSEPDRFLFSMRTDTTAMGRLPAGLRQLFRHAFASPPRIVMFSIDASGGATRSWTATARFDSSADIETERGRMTAWTTLLDAAKLTQAGDQMGAQLMQALDITRVQAKGQSLVLTGTLQVETLAGAFGCASGSTDAD